MTQSFLIFFVGTEHQKIKLVFLKLGWRIRKKDMEDNNILYKEKFREL